MLQLLVQLAVAGPHTMSKWPRSLESVNSLWCVRMVLYYTMPVLELTRCPKKPFSPHTHNVSPGSIKFYEAIQ